MIDKSIGKTVGYEAAPKNANKYWLTFLVWNNLLALLITLAVPRSETVSFLDNLMCILVVSHVTAFFCLIAVDLFRPIQRRLFGTEERILYFSSLLPMTIVVVPALIAGFYASIWFADLFSIAWHPEVVEIILPGILFSLITFVLNILYYNYIYSVREYYLKEMELKTAQTVALENKLQVLMSELNPHMLFNALNAIIELVRKDAEQAENMLLELCDYYQTVLVSFEKQFIKLEEELTLCEKFIALHKHKYSNVRLDISIDEKLKTVLVPPLILQPLLENSLRHGYVSSAIEDEKLIRIVVQQAENRMLISVIDNGVGFSATHEDLGVGLKNCEERLKNFFGPTSLLTIQSNSVGGTAVILDIPYAND